MNRFLSASLCVLVLAAIAAPNLFAAQKFHSGAATWDTTSAVWGTVSGGPYTTTFANGDDAVFEGTAGTITVVGSIAANSITFNVTGYTITGGTNITLNAVNTTMNVAAGTATISSVVAGVAANSLAKTGAGTLVLSATNTYAGKTLINGGTISAGLDSNLGAAPGAATVGQLTLNGGTLLCTAPFTVAATRGVAVGPTAGPGPGTVDVGTNAVTIAGIIANNGVGSGNLIKLGTGTLTLTGANTFSGGLTIDAGVLSVATDAALGGASSPVTINGSTLRITAAITLVATRPIRLGPPSGSGGGTVDHGANTVLLTGVISNNGVGTGSLTKVGTGFLRLDNANNTYTGMTFVNQGTLRLTGVGGGINGTAGVSLLPAPSTGTAVLDLNLTTGATFNKPLIMNSIAVGDFRSSLINTTGTSIWSGPITCIGDRLHQITVNAGQLTVTGPVSGAGTGTLFVRGGGGNGILDCSINLPNGNVSRTDSTPWILNTNGNNWLATGILTGNMKIGINNAFPITTPLQMGQTGTNTPTFDLNGFNQQIGALNDTPAAAVVMTNTSATLSTLTINNTNASVYRSTISGNLALTKTGTGSLALGGTNSHTGDTTVSQGTLSATAAVSGIPNRLIMSSGTYAWTGAGSGTVSIGELTGASGILGNATSTTTATFSVGSDNTDSTYSGTIQNNVNGSTNAVTAIIKVGTGALTWTSNTTHTGITQVNAGRLSLRSGTTHTTDLAVAANAVLQADITSSGGQIGVGDLTLNAGASTLSIDEGALTLSGATSPVMVNGDLNTGAGAQVKVRVGTLVPGTYPLVTYTGAFSGSVPTSVTTVPRSTATLNHNTGTKTIELVVTAVIAVAQPLRWATVSGIWDVATTPNWRDSAGTLTTYFDFPGSSDNVVFEDTQSGVSPINVNVSTNVSPNSFLVNGTKDFAFTGTGGILGATGVTKQGAGILTLGTTNLYTGATTVNGGTLAITADNNLGAPPAAPAASHLVIDNSAKLQINGAPTLSANRGLALGPLAGAGNATIEVTLTNVAVVGGTVGNNGAGTGGLTKTGTGTLTLSNTGSYAGPTNVNFGTLRLTNTNAIAGTSGVVMNTSIGGAGTIGTQLELQNAGTIAGKTLTLNSNGTGDFRTAIRSTAGANVWTGPIILNGSGLGQAYCETAGSLALNGPISDGGLGFTGRLVLRGNTAGITGTVGGTISLPATTTVTKTGDGTWVLTGAGNTWGATGCAVGTLRLGVNDALPVNTIVTMGEATAANTTLDLNGFNQTIGGIILSTTGGTKLLTNSSATVGTLTVNNTANYSYADNISGALALTKTGTGMLTLSDVNTHTGPTTVTQGTLALGNALTSIPARLVMNGGTFVWKGPGNGNQTIGELSGTTGIVANDTATSTATFSIGSLNTNASYSGSIQDNIGAAGAVTAITKTGSGTLTLASSQTYTGATLIIGGKLVGVTPNSIQSPVTINDFSTLGVQVAASNAQWSCSALTCGTGGPAIEIDFGALAFSNATAPLRVMNNLAMTSTTQIVVKSTAAGLAAGTYPLIRYGTFSGTIPAVPASLPGALGATLNNNVGTSTIELVVNSTVQPLTWQAPGTDIWQGNHWRNAAAAIVPFTNGDNVVFDATPGAGPFTVTVNSAVNPASMLVNFANTYTFSGTGNIGGNCRLTKSGNGVLIMSMANSFTGPVTINCGPTAASGIRITNSAALGNAVSVSLQNSTFIGGTGVYLEMQGATVNNIPLLMNSTNVGGSFRSALRGTSGANTWNGPIIMNGNDLNQLFVENAAATLAINGPTIAGPSGFTGTYFVRGGSGTGTINGTITLPGATVNKTDANTWIIAGPGNTWGNTTVSVGTLRMGIANAVPATTNLQMGQNDANNSTFDINGFNQTIASLALLSTGGTKLVTNSSPTPATLTIENTAANTYSQPITGALGLTKNNAGTLTLSGANTFTRPVNVNAGILQIITQAAALGAPPSVTLMNTTTAGGAGTQLELQSSLSFANTITLNMNSTAAGNFRTALRSTNGTNTWNGPIVCNGDNLDQLYADGGNLNVTGPISGPTFNGTLFIRGATNTGTISGTINLPNGNVSKTDSSTWVISSTNNNWLGTGVFVGTLRMGAINALPPATLVTMGQNDANNATLDLNGFSQTVGGLALSTTGGTKNITSASPAILTVDLVGARSYGSLISGSILLNKINTGTLTISGANTYSNGTTVSNGVLEVTNATGSATGTGSISLSGNGTLAGTGAVAGDTNFISGGNVSPGLGGTGMGELTLGNVNFTGGTLNMQLLVPDNGQSGVGSDDEIQVNGNVTLGGTLNILGSGLVVGQYHLMNYTGTVAGSFATINAPDGYTGTIVAAGGSIDVYLNHQPVMQVIGDRSVNEGQTFSFTVVATDADSPAQTVTYSTVEPLPAGATFNPNNGAFSWATNDGPGQTVTLHFRATDDAVPALFAEEIVTLTVNGVAPTATFANGGAVNEGSTGAVTFSNQFDPSTVDTSAGLRYSYDFQYNGVTPNFTMGGNSYGTAVAAASPVVPASALDDNPSTTVLGRIWDKDGSFTDYTTTITVNNVTPTATLINSGDVTEGTTSATVTFQSPFDPSTADAAVLHYAYDVDNDGLFDAGDGTYLGSLSVNSAVVPAAALNDGPFNRVVRARIIDKDGAFNDYFTTIVVSNVAPSAFFANNGSVGEGNPAIVTFTGQSDPSPVDTSATFHYSYVYNYTGGAPVFDIGGNSYGTASAQPSITVPPGAIVDGPSTQTILGRVWDKDGGFTDYTTVLTIDNVAPSLTSLDAAAIVENSIASLTGTIVDPGVADTFDMTIDWGDGNSENYNFGAANGSQNFSEPHQYLEDGAYLITVTVTDNNGGSDQQTTVCNVSNANPVLNTNAIAPVIDEHSTTGVITLVTFTDAGSLDTHTVTIDWGDGSPLDLGGVLAEPAGATPGSIMGGHLYDDGPAVRVVTVTITDDDTGAGQATFNVFVNNVAPTATFQRADANVFSPFTTVEFVNPNDVSDADRGAGFLYNYDFNDDGIYEIIASTSASAAVPVQYQSQNPNHTIRGKIVDKDGGATEYRLQQPFFITDPIEIEFDLGSQSSYTVSANGSPTPTYQITVIDLPDGIADLAAVGLSVSGGTISGTPFVGGLLNLRVVATNSGGSAVADLMVTIKRSTNSNTPQIKSAATANPNPCITGTPVEFSVVATDSDGDLLSYFWDFKDGSTARGRVVTHTYTVPGKYFISCVVSDGSNIANGDFNLVVARGEDNLFDVAQAKISFDFRKPERSTLYITGFIPVPSGPLAGVNADVSISDSGYTQTFQFNSAGAGGDNMSLFSLKTIQTGSGTSRAKFVFSLKSTNGLDPLKPSLHQKLSPLGFITGRTERAGNPVDVTLVVTIGAQATLTSTFTTTYKTAPTRSGKAQYKRK